MLEARGVSRDAALLAAASEAAFPQLLIEALGRVEELRGVVLGWLRHEDTVLVGELRRP